MVGKGWRCTHEPVHKKGSGDTRRFVAIAGVLLSKGGMRGLAPVLSYAVSTVGGAHTKQSIHQVVHTQGGL